MIEAMIPGEYFLEDSPIEANVGRRVVRVSVRHTGDRPVQVGSHYHFFEVNNALDFDRDQTRGMRLNLAAGTSVRFEPGEEKEVELVELAGARLVFGHQGKGGAAAAPAKKASKVKAAKKAKVTTKAKVKR